MPESHIIDPKERGNNSSSSPSFRVSVLSYALREFRASLLAALWFSVLTLPLLVFRINANDYKIDYMWGRLPKLAVLAFFASFVWRLLLRHLSFSRVRSTVAELSGPPPDSARSPGASWFTFLSERESLKVLLGILLLFLASLPFWVSPYVVTVLITALIYITLGLGLNIVVGVSGLLNLGYVAFYAIGAYTYALLNHYLGLGFWVSLPLGALAATLLGLFLSLPILRLSGDYLAIVTLGFAEIVKLVLTNVDFTNGPRGIAGIDPPGFFGMDLNLGLKSFLVNHRLMHPDMDLNKVLLFFIILFIVLLTIICVHRLEHSRLGRAWLAMREDEVASEAMGVNIVKAKVTAFTLGSTWAGLAGVVFASQITFINPASFTFMQSVMILSIVVLGGMGSIPGVILGALVLILLPEYLRSFADYRMLLFGLLMVLMMVFRPEGLIKSVRKVFVYVPDKEERKDETKEDPGDKPVDNREEPSR
jgi:branched-chain amino acid transport system permease protein